MQVKDVLYLMQRKYQKIQTQKKSASSKLLWATCRYEQQVLRACEHHAVASCHNTLVFSIQLQTKFIRERLGLKK